MTTHYVTTLGVAKCREILKGAPETATTARISLCGNQFLYGRSENSVGGSIVSLSAIRAELSLHDTDDFKHLANHVSPNTVVVG